MKKVIIVLILGFTEFNVVGQNKNIDSLLNYGLIDKEIKNEFELMLNRQPNIIGLTYLMNLFYFNFKTETGSYPNDRNVNFYFNYEKHKVIDQKTTNDSLTVYLKILRKCNLINDYVFENQKELIKNNNHKNTVYLLESIIRQVSFFEKFSVVKLSEFYTKLNELELFDSNYLNQIEKDIKEKRIFTPVDIFGYSKKSILIKLKEYPNDPSNYLEEIYIKTASVLPELKFEKFNFEISTENVDDLILENLKVSFTVNGKIFDQEVTNIISVRGVSENSKLNINDYYEIFNKVLAFNQSPLRLHVLYNEIDSGTDNAFAIIALNEPQSIKIHQLSNFITTEKVDFTNILDIPKLNNALDEYLKIGLLKDSKSMKLKIKNIETNTYNKLISLIPNLTFDYHSIKENDKNLSVKILNKISKLSKGEFFISNASEKIIFKNKQINDGDRFLKFNFRNKTYNFKYPSYFSLTLIDDIANDINKILKTHKAKGKFYIIGNNFYDDFLIYLNRNQFETLKNNKLVDFKSNEVELRPID